MLRSLFTRRHSDAPPARRFGLSALLLAFSVVLFALTVGCKGGSQGGTGLLANKTPIETKGISGVERLNDGRVPAEGTAWNSNRTAVFSSKSGYAIFDLGEDKPIESVALLGDNNDTYRLLGRSEGGEFELLWEATSVQGAGLRWRKTNSLGKRARYLKLEAGRGDSSLSIAELVVFSEPAIELPPRLETVSALDSGLTYRNAILVLTAVVVMVVALTWTGAPWSLLIAAALALGWALRGYISVYLSEFPIGQLEVSLTRAASAFMAAAVIARETYGPRDKQPITALNIGVLAFSAVLAVGSFYNLGHPQFYDHKNREPSVVHNYDMRVYFPVAKYFDELKYDGLYLASVATYAEEHGGLDTPEMKRTELRDLRDHRMRKVPAIRQEIEDVKKRFSPERWEELKRDMRYFWETMGSHAYLGSMADHGGNATPVWLTLAYFMFKSAPASNEVLIWAGLLDPLLLLVFAVAIWRAFGARTALVSLVLFGANDFYMFGSNWAGATLRHDWMVYLGLGAAALKTKRYKTGGAFLAMAALIRAFPAISLIALGVPVLYFVLEKVKELGRAPSLKEIIEGNRWFIDAAIGAVACVAGWVLFSSLVLGFDAWPLWVKKISSFTASPHVNHISLLTVTAGSEGNQAIVLRERLPLHIGVTAAFVIFALWAAYRRPPHVAAMLGMLLMPVFMYPANYYDHFIFLLAVLVSEPLMATTRVERETSGKVWLTLLLLCSALYMTVKINDLAMHFYQASVLLMAALGAVLVYLVPRTEDGAFLFPEPLKVLWEAKGSDKKTGGPGRGAKKAKKKSGAGSDDVTLQSPVMPDKRPEKEEEVTLESVAAPDKRAVKSEDPTLESPVVPDKRAAKEETAATESDKEESDKGA